MMDDIKTIKCNPKDEVSVIQLWESFGYSLQHSGEIYNKDSVNTVNDCGDFVFVGKDTEITNYVKMVFRRSHNIPNYQELVALEKEYDSIELPKKPVEWSIFEILIGLCIFTIPGVLMIISNQRLRNNQLPKWEKEMQAALNQRDGIVMQARELVV